MVGGGALPAVRVELNPSMLNKYGIGLEQVRTAIAATNANTPKGQVSVSNQRWEIGANDQLLQGDRLRAADHRLSQRRAGPDSRCRRRARIRSRTSGPPATSTASRR